MSKSQEYDNFRKKINEVLIDWTKFKVEFFDQYNFKEFANKLYQNLNGWGEICITGYFGETIREDLEKFIMEMPSRKVKIITKKLSVDKRSDRLNLEALRKLAKAGAKIKVNDRVHARIFVAYHPDVAYHPTSPRIIGVLVIGSFDFNKDGVSGERHDAGIKTQHPDLVGSAIQFFKQIWDDSSSLTLDKVYPKS